MIKEKSKTWAMISSKLGTLFGRLPFSPNCYSWLTVPPAVLGFVAMLYGWIVTGVLLFLLSGFLDLIDGAVARQTNQVSHAGAFLDGSLDRFVDFLLVFSYFWVPITMPWLPSAMWICIACFFILMPSFEVAYANHRQAVDDPTETLIWRILNRGEMYPLMCLVPLLALMSPVVAGYLFFALIMLSALTTFQTVFSTLQKAQG